MLRLNGSGLNGSLKGNKALPVEIYVHSAGHACQIVAGQRFQNTGRNEDTGYTDFQYLHSQMN